jgi:ubiquitin-conjugating enzyme E2 M
MIKLFSLKQQKKDGETAPKTGNQKKPSAAQLRITKGGWVLQVAIKKVHRC